MYAGFQFLDAWLNAKASARQQEIQRRLPGFIDLLTLTIEGGLDLMAQGPTSGDQVPFHAMINGGERVTIQTPAQQQRAGTNDNSRSVVVNNSFDMRGVSTSNSRRSMRQFAQGFGQATAAAAR